ncbi:hypothetical protein DRO42_08705 [Candidatus Bathyarchaeota archaeon]|nr:MAG: hypothetical protein DRO42_08705 [Candidatus Bathyarchaeota archaeon]
MDYTVVASVFTSILAVTATILGVKYRRLKGKAERFRELVAYFIEAWEDDRLSAEEVEGLVRRGKALVEPEGEP